MSLLTSGWFWLLIVALFVTIVWIVAARRAPAAESGPEAKLVTDPVCLMRFAPDKAVAKARHGGETYYFCAEACLRDFQQDPDRYAGSSQESVAS